MKDPRLIAAFNAAHRAWQHRQEQLSLLTLVQPESLRGGSSSPVLAVPQAPKEKVA